MAIPVAPTSFRTNEALHLDLKMVRNGPQFCDMSCVIVNFLSPFGLTLQDKIIDCPNDALQAQRLAVD